jgi:hypothetical protein
VVVDDKPIDHATYSIVDSAGNCKTPVLNGRFTWGVALSNQNTITLNVNVTSPGAYAITTDTVNGIYFNASGSFTVAGNQTVTLRGYGTPNDAGNFYYRLAGASSACSIKVGVQSPEPLATYVLESGPGNPPPCISVVAGNYNANVQLTSADSVTIRAYVTVPGNFTISTTRVNGMMFTYSGTFTSTGIQYVTLYGSGTPVATGTYTFRSEIIGPHPIGGEVCGFNVVVN